ncbi:hypothetical protein ACRS8P_17130 [Burkholderia cenocepacia]
MSTSKRMFDDLGDARRLRRAPRDLSKHRQHAIEQIFDTGLAYVCELFAETPVALRSESFPDYPGAVWTGDVGVSAFFMTQDVEVEQFPIYVNLLTKGRERAGPRRTRRFYRKAAFVDERLLEPAGVEFRVTDDRNGRG